MAGRLELLGELNRFQLPNVPLTRVQHGSGHGFGSFLNVHEGPQSFSSDTVLVPGHVLTNEPGYCTFALLPCFAAPRAR